MDMQKIASAMLHAIDDYLSAKYYVYLAEYADTRALTESMEFQDLLQLISTGEAEPGITFAVLKALAEQVAKQMRVINPRRAAQYAERQVTADRLLAYAMALYKTLH